MTAEFNFQGDDSIVIGDDFTHEFYFEDAECEPLTQTGDFYAQIRKAGVLIAEFTCSITGADNNIVLLTMSSAVTDALAPTKGASWDLENHTPAISTILGGSVNIVRGVTEVP